MGNQTKESLLFLHFFIFSSSPSHIFFLSLLLTPSLPPPLPILSKLNPNIWLTPLIDAFSIKLSLMQNQYLNIFISNKHINLKKSKTMGSN